jgi:hypothetical protein
MHVIEAATPQGGGFDALKDEHQVPFSERLSVISAPLYYD